MLGRTLKDPYGVEHGGEMAGLGLLPSTTVFGRDKVRTRVSGTFETVQGIFAQLSGVSFEGYEIHMGTSLLEEGAVLSSIAETGESPKADGLNQGNIYGSYVHGIFDSEKVAKTIVSALLRAKGLDDGQVAGIDMAAYKEQQYDLLADGIRQSIDMDLLYQIVEEGVNYGK